MTTPYTWDGSGNLEGSYNLPDDGDTADAASVDVPFETVIRDMIRGLYRKRVQVAPVRYLVHGHPVPDVGVTSVWQQIFVAGVGFPWKQTSVTPANNGAHDYTLMFPILIPDQAALTNVVADITPATHSALPATMPNLAIEEYDPSANTMSSLCNVSDTTAPFGSYNLRHTFQIIQANMPGGTAILAARGTKILRLRVTGEFGANSVLGLTLNSVKVVFSTSNEDPGAG